MKKICCLLALAVLAGRPAFADETPATPPEKQNTVLGQTEKKAAQDTTDKKARDIQALFEEREPAADDAAGSGPDTGISLAFG